MKYRLTFECTEPVSLPVQYNKILQAALLTWLQDESFTSFLHDTGFDHDLRKYKLYTFSNLLGGARYDHKQHRLTFKGAIQVILSFYGKADQDHIFKASKSGRPLRLGRYDLTLIRAELIQEYAADCIVEAVSPVTIHSTFELPNGKRKTYYYYPEEEDFSDMIKDNLTRKIEAVRDIDCPDLDFSIRPVGKAREAKIFYNRFLIIGWSGTFKMTGNPAMIEMALLSGVGARNSIGMGCLVQKEVLVNDLDDMVW